MQDRYDPGDVALVHPAAPPSLVEACIKTIGWENFADDPIKIQQTLSDQTLPLIPTNSTTLRTLLTYAVDIAAVPRRSFFQLLQHFVTNELEKERLAEFASVEAAVRGFVLCLYISHCFRYRMSYMNMLNVHVEQFMKCLPSFALQEFPGNIYLISFHLCDPDNSRLQVTLKWVIFILFFGFCYSDVSEASSPSASVHCRCQIPYEIKGAAGWRVHVVSCRFTTW